MVGKTAPGIRLGTLLVMIALAVSSCNGDDAAAETTVATTIPTTTTTAPTTAPPTTAAPTTTTAAPPTTADPLARPEVLISNFDRESVDDFDTTGDDLYRITLELDDLYNYFEGNPADSVEAMIDRLFTEGYPHRDYQERAFGDLVTNGWQYIDPGIETVAVDVLDVSGDTALVRHATRRGDQRIEDDNGVVVKVLRGWELDAGVLTLERGDDGNWRVSDAAENAPISDEELAQMVPVQWTGRSR